jgi:hypothetical protein
MGRKPPEGLRLGAADAQFAAFCLSAPLVGSGLPLERKIVKTAEQAKTLA